MRREPRWVIAFLRALERTGRVREAAADAGVDHSTVYARRRAHADFAQAWAAAVKAHRERVKAEEAEEIAAIRNSPSIIRSPVDGPPPHAPHRELVASGGQVKRAARERWGKRKEAIFFDELAATNNITLSANAAGVSYNAVHARRLRDPLFAAKWDAVSRSSRAAIDMHLLAETRKNFEPETLDQAIKISQIGAAAARSSGRGSREAEADPFQEQAAAMGEDELDTLRAKVLRKIERLAERNKADKLTQGWSYDEASGQMVPPGWVRQTR
jgi:hypothetical protein